MSSTSINELLNVLKPVNEANGLPNRHYTDGTVFKREKDCLLFDNWSGVAFGKDVPRAGDVYPVYFLAIPLLIVRGLDNKIKVFQNTCRHRGMLLISRPQNVRGTITCPYHSWCYGLNGELRSTPHVGGPKINIHSDINKSELALYEIKSYVWHDVVFVNISGTAQRFQDTHHKLMRRWLEFDQPLYHSGKDSSIELIVNCNWKLAVENYCESYHLPWIHPGLNTYSKLDDHYNIEEKGFYSGQGSYVYKQLKQQDGTTFSDFQRLSKKWDTGSEYISLFPNVLLGVHRDHTIAIILQPISIEKTQERIEIHYASQATLSDKHSLMRKRNKTLWTNIFEEDRFVVEGMQKGRSGLLFDGGKFSAIMDGPTHIFHHWVAKQYLQHIRDVENGSE
jgi:choline monooxygenase